MHAPSILTEEVGEWGSSSDIKKPLYGDDVTFINPDLKPDVVADILEKQMKQYQETKEKLLEIDITLQEPWWEIRLKKGVTLQEPWWVSRWRAIGVKKDE